jgi:hypothetical protein
VTIFTRPTTLLRIEGAATLVVAAYLYSIVSGDWLLFALLLLVPDVAILGYIRGSIVGAAVYNLLHTEIGPLILAAAALNRQVPVALAIALVWLAHIGMDRMLGYGLKLTSGFRDTHLGRIGRPEIPPSREW